MKKVLLGILIGGIVFGTIGAGAAYVYTARDINYQSSDENWNVNNVQEAISELKTDVNTISNKVEGIERVYKAGEVELVALVSDDSFYKDSNDKYVLSNSDTGRTLLADASTYKSLPSTDDCIGVFDGDVVIPINNGINISYETQVMKIRTGSPSVTFHFEHGILGISSMGNINGLRSLSISGNKISGSYGGDDKDVSITAIGY